MAASTQWQLARDAAERYERILVPTILGPAARALVEWSDPQPGEVVLDVGCGTGAAARFAAERVGNAGRVAGVDVSAGMIAVARSLPPVCGAAVEWHEASACRLPFADAVFDRVLCSQTLQFLQDRPGALAEIHRVLKPGGRVAVSAWCDIQENPYFDALVQAMTREVGADTAAGLRAAFALGALTDIQTLLSGAGFTNLEAVAKRLELDLPNLLAFVPRHVSATPMAAGFDAAPRETRRAVVESVANVLARYATGAGVRVAFRTHLVGALK